MREIVWQCYIFLFLTISMWERFKDFRLQFSLNMGIVQRGGFFKVLITRCSSYSSYQSPSNLLTLLIRPSKCHKNYTSNISDQKLYPKEMSETTNKYKRLKPNWPANPLQPFNTKMYLLWSKFAPIDFNLPTKLI